MGTGNGRFGGWCRRSCPCDEVRKEIFFFLVLFVFLFFLFVRGRATSWNCGEGGLFSFVGDDDDGGETTHFDFDFVVDVFVCHFFFLFL